MGLKAVILSFTRAFRRGARVSDVKVDTGGGENKTAEHFAPSGDDSFPLLTDYVFTVEAPRSGSLVAVGYLDPKNTPKAGAGDKRIYARDADSGEAVAEVWLKSDSSVIVSNANGETELKADGSAKSSNAAGSHELKADGSIKGQNGAGSFELSVGGSFLVNGVEIDPSGNITSPAAIAGVTVSATTSMDSPSITSNGKELGVHTHPAGTPPGDTGDNI